MYGTEYAIDDLFIVNNTLYRVTKIYTPDNFELPEHAMPQYILSPITVSDELEQETVTFDNNAHDKMYTQQDLKYQMSITGPL